MENFGLHAAARSGDLSQIKLLLDVGLEISAPDENGSVALHHAAEWGKEQAVILLLEKGADRLAVDNTGKIALHLAACGGHYRVVRRLKYEADMAARDFDQRTALHLAASRGYDKVVHELVKNEADVMAVDKDRRTALHLAALAGHKMVVKRLLMRGADISAVDNEQKKALHLAAVAGHDIVIGELLDHSPIADKNWFEAIQLAVSAGHNKVVQKLLDYKDDILTENEDLMTAVYWAASGGNLDLLKFLLNDVGISHDDDLALRAPDDSILDDVERTISQSTGVNFPSSQLIIPGMPDGALVIAEFVYQCQSQRSSVPNVSVCGQWDGYQHTPMTPIGGINEMEELLFAVSIQVPAGHYSYFFEVDGVRLRDPSSTEQPVDSNDSTHQDPTAPSPLAMPWPPVIIGNDEPPQIVFKLQFRRLLKSIGAGTVAAVQNLLPEITVFISMRLTFSETRLPRNWMFRDTTYTVRVQFDNSLVEADNPQDLSSRVLQAIERAWMVTKKAQTPISVQDSLGVQDLEDFILFHQEQLSKLKKVTYVGILPLCFEGQNVHESLIVITTDWEASQEIEESLLSGEWEGKPVYFVRDEWKNLHKEPPYLDKVLVGARGGGGNMTAGVILCDRNRPEERYMVQCAHGYRRSGIGSQCYYPPASSCGDALKQTTRERAAEENNYEQSRQLAAAEKTRLGWNIWQPAGIVIPGFSGMQKWPWQENEHIITERARCLAAREEILKDASATVDSDDSGVFYAPKSSPRGLSIGTVMNLSTTYNDIALVKLRLTNTYGIERSFNDPPNLLKPSWAVSPARHTTRTRELPLAITALSTSDQSAVKAEFCLPGNWLGKMGAGTGFTQFCTDNRSVILLDGKRASGLVPLRRGFAFSHDTILDEGDSSAPVFGFDGVMQGFITAKLDAAEIGFMVLWSEAARCIKEWGYDLVLA